MYPFVDAYKPEILQPNIYDIFKLALVILRILNVNIWISKTSVKWYFWSKYKSPSLVCVDLDFYLTKFL